MTGCNTCGCALDSRNKSGFCKRHVAAAMAQDPEWKAKHRAVAIDVGAARRLPPCAVCNRRLKVRNKLGLCQACKKQHFIDRNRTMAQLHREGVDLVRLADRFGLSHNAAKCAIRDYISHPRTATMANILAVASELTGFTVQDLVGTGRRAPLVRTRQASCYIGHRCGLSYAQIGRAINRDHTTAVYGRQMCEERIARDPEYGDLVERIMIEAQARKPFELCKPPVVPVAVEIARVDTREPEQEPEPAEELDEMDLLSRAVAQHYAVAA